MIAGCPVDVEDHAEYSSNVFDAGKILHFIVTRGKPQGTWQSNLEVMHCSLLAHSLEHNLKSRHVQTHESTFARYNGSEEPCVLHASLQGLLQVFTAAY